MPPKSTTKVPRVCVHCGASFLVYPSIIKRGPTHGQFCSTQCRYAHMQKEQNPTWQGGRNINAFGYVEVHVGPKQYQREHRFVMEQILGRPLSPDEDVHHIDGNKLNNDPSNLMVLSKSDHAKLHAPVAQGKIWSRKYDCCINCGSTEYKHRDHGLCTKCHARLRWRNEHPQKRRYRN